MTEKITGIMGAMPEEIAGLLPLLVNREETVAGMRVYYTGLLNGRKVVIVFSRWGKTAAAATVSALILKFGITELIFTGVAGGIHKDLHIGDIVVATRLIQHDMDARPIMPRYEIPLLGKTFFECDHILVSRAQNAVSNLLENNHLHEVITNEELQRFNITQPKLHSGCVASGDQFFSADEDKLALTTALPDVLCVEMEGAAVAQLCYEYKIPFVIIRTISDAADNSSAIDFPEFIKSISSKYSQKITGIMLA